MCSKRTQSATCLYAPNVPQTISWTPETKHLTRAPNVPPERAPNVLQTSLKRIPNVIQTCAKVFDLETLFFDRFQSRPEIWLGFPGYRLGHVWCTHLIVVWGSFWAAHAQVRWLAKCLSNCYRGYCILSLTHICHSRNRLPMPTASC